MTNGAVSQADAQRWADANDWDSGWAKWAEANAQPALLPYLSGPALISPTEEQALAVGATIDQPDCNLYPTSEKLFPTGADGQAYFARKGLPANDSYVLVAVYAGPCTAVATYPDGHTQTISELTAPSTAFLPGSLRHDPLLGDIWYADAGGNCSDPLGPPPTWCGR